MDHTRYENGPQDIQAFYPQNIHEWRSWLDLNHGDTKAVWLITYRKGSEKPTITYDEAIEHALCYGWIDSKALRRDHESSYLYFSPRKLTSNWSITNHKRIEKMTALGLMRPAGQAVVDHAKTIGTWDILTDAQNLIIPEDLQSLFDKNTDAHKNFKAFPPSARQMILEWIATAKKPETRKKRVMQTVELAAQNIRARK